MIVAGLVLLPGIGQASNVKHKVFLRSKLKHVMSRQGTKDPKYLEAINHIKLARAAIRDYLATNPTGDAAYFAKVQLKALDNLIVTDLPMAPVEYVDEIKWRILTIDPTDSYTKIELEFINDSGRKNSFRWFDGNDDLVLVANGKSYKMRQESLTIPKGVETTNNNFGIHLELQDSQSVKFAVYFDALDPGITVGYVARRAQGNPRVSFSLLNKNQLATGGG